MSKYTLSPWFDMQKDGPPVRRGVYEGTAVGIPGETGTLQHGYYFWNGQRWTGWATKASAVDARAPAVFQATFWRGVLPDQDYPYDQVDSTVIASTTASTVSPSYAGTLQREGGSDDKLLVERLHEAADRISFKFARARGTRPPEHCDCSLTMQEGEYRGSTRARISGFTSPRDTQIRVISRSKSGNGLKLSVAVNSGDDWHVFTGELVEFPGREVPGTLRG